ncbi:MAG: hypothetical protein C0510_08660 [Erythrobacter sp.]|nr:hypothetical protein [Erythrobacter sp.]
MNGLVEQAEFTPGPATILTPPRQAAFLENLMVWGNARLACRAAAVSPQTAYRERRRSPAFARAWDAALLSARQHAEEVLADRALNGVEEAVFYHGEEVARRTRFDSRLLLAHLARLDRLAERAEVAAMLPLLDDAIAGLHEGVGLRETPACAGDHERERYLPKDSVPGVPGSPSHRAFAGAADDPAPDQLPDLERRLQAMEAARPDDAPPIGDWSDPGLAEAMQLAAFEAGMDNWWLAGPVDRE